MEKTKSKQIISSLDAKVDAELPKVIKIKPGSSSEKSVKLILPKTLEDASINEVISYALNNPDIKRKDIRIADRVRVEMESNYGIIVNENTVKGSEKISNYFTPKKSQSGLEYEEAEIIVASEQEGGLRKVYV